MNHAAVPSRIRCTVEDEQAALGALLADPERWFNRVTPELFAVDVHRHIADLFRSQYIEAGRVEWSLLIEALAVRLGWAKETALSTLNEIGDFGLLHETAGELGIRNLERAREARLADDAIRRAFAAVDGGGDAVEALSRLRESSTPTRVDGALTTLADLLVNDPADDTDSTMPTGIALVDAALPGGGFRAGDKVAIGGPPGVGKTTFAAQLVTASLIRNPDLRVVWAAAEMTLKALRNRMLVNVCGLTLETLSRPWAALSPTQEESKRQGIETLRSLGDRLTFIEAPVTPGRIESAVRSTGARLAVVDYIQLVHGDRVAESATRRDEVDGVIRALCGLTQATDATLILLSNMAKGATVARDIYSAFKETSELAHAVDLAFVGEIVGGTPDDDADLPPVVPIRWRCLKARHGSPRSIVADFDRPLQRFIPRGGARW